MPETGGFIPWMFALFLAEDQNLQDGQNLHDRLDLTRAWSLHSGHLLCLMNLVLAFAHCLEHTLYQKGKGWRS